MTFFNTLLVLLAACAASPAARVPYPAFVQAEALEESFIATLPGTRARELFVDSRHGVSTLLLDLPADWRWNAGGAPGKSVEIYVLEGEIALGDLTLLSGNYAYLPPGSTGLPMASARGARLLYVLDDADPRAVIRTPLFMSREVVPWQSLADTAADAGWQRKILREDPGSGAATYLLSIGPGRRAGWHASPVRTEGFLLSGDDQLAECVAGAAVVGEYAPGGYFRRPAGAVSGGPEARSETGAEWLIRETGRGERTPVAACRASAPPPPRE